MTLPDALPDAHTRQEGDTPAASLRLEVLKDRSDFLKAARAAWKSAPAMVVQARLRQPDEAGQGIRVGFTCSKKVGNAVARNRAKRRLRAAARDVLLQHGRPGWDYVLIGRKDSTAKRPYHALVADLRSALAQLHR